MDTAMFGLITRYLEILNHSTDFKCYGKAAWTREIGEWYTTPCKTHENTILKLWMSKWWNGMTGKTNI